MNFVIGDVHGEVTKLKSLIKLIDKNEANPSFIFIGDYIDKGENSKKLLDYLIELKSKYPIIFLLGNHEYYWIKMNKNSILKYGGLKHQKTLNLNQLRIVKSKSSKITSKYLTALKIFMKPRIFLYVTVGFQRKILRKVKLKILILILADMILSSKSFFKKEANNIWPYSIFYTVC